MSFYDDNRDNFDGNLGSYRKRRKIANDSTKHYPNKDEARELRKIMASTGLTEEEVRADKTHRKALAEAQKAGQKAKRTETERTFQKFIKQACKKTGLVPQHPETIKALQEILDTRARGYFRRSFFIKNNHTAETIVKQYAK